MSKVKKSVTVQAPVDIVYRAWHNFENFPNFMSNIDEVSVVEGGRSHWKAKGPLGSTAEWDAEVTMDTPNTVIGWRSIDGNSSVKTAGRVDFRDQNGGTGIDVTLEYDAPGGVVGDVVTKIFANPDQQIEEDLQRFKELMEKGAELSGMNFGNVMSGEASLGGSMGAVNEQDLDAIASSNSGMEPDAVDDPGKR